MNNNDPLRPENWFAAVWDYNEGFNAPQSSSGPWGLGWFDNPANPIYPPTRLAFMDTTLDPKANADAAHPQDWPYEEKVMGWAAWSIDTGFSYATSGRQDWKGEPGFNSTGFRPAWWATNADRSAVKPPLDAFCNATNNCNAAAPPTCTDASCYQQYWWHGSNVTWKADCDTSCGHENIKYQTLINEPGRGYRLLNGTPDCSAPPSGARVVASIPNGTPTWSACGTATSDGTFQFTFNPDSAGNYEAKGDLHQIGGGYQGHFWYAHTRGPGQLGGDSGPMTVLGDWKLSSALAGGQGMVYVHIPDTGANTTSATYQIVTPFGTVTQTITQKAYESNKWISLGAYRFNDQAPEVKLSNSSSVDTNGDDIAWGAVAFVPGDYTGMPNITYPNPDPTAPFPDWAGDIEVAHRHLPAAAGTATSQITSPKAAGGTNCSTTSKTGVEMCLTLGKPQAKDSTFSKNMGATSSSELVPWCDGLTGDQYTRTDACLNALTPLGVTFIVNGEPVGTASFAIQQEIKLYNNIGEFDQSLSLVPMHIDAALGVVTLTWNASSSCSDCTQSQQKFDGALTWAGPTDTHAGNVSFQTIWNGTGQESLTLGWGISGTISSAPGLIESADLGNSSGGLEVRCDDTTKGTTSAGCVFPSYTPTYTVNSARYPAAAAYYWLMKEKNGNHFGSRPHATPLHYLANGQVDNRAIVCPSSWTGRSETPNASCDEYPFATTYESGGMPNSGVTSGDQCGQFYAAPINSTTWTLYNDDRYPLPTWLEKCGRASIPNDQNTGALAPFGRTGGFVPYNRMLDKDPFWLATPGFDHCTTADTTCTYQ